MQARNFRRALFAGLALLCAGCPQEDDKPAWKVVLDGQDLDRALLSVWGASPTDVYVVGGSLGNGKPTLALRHLNGEWRDLAPGGNETLWWVSGTTTTDVWMVGEKGRILHWDGALFRSHDSGTSATLWGAIAFSRNEAWAVGGMPGDDTPDDVLLRWDGSRWSAESLPGAARNLALFKVWGTSSDDLYVVGENGIIWHRKAGVWTAESDADTPTLASDRLFTVFGCSATEIYAVGSLDVLRSNGTTWAKVPEAEARLPNVVNGVSCGGGSALMVGFGGFKLRRGTGATTFVDESRVQPFQDLHGSWADGEGGFWVVGGDFISPARPDQRRIGVVARYGTRHVGTTITLVP